MACPLDDSSFTQNFGVLLQFFSASVESSHILGTLKVLEQFTHETNSSDRRTKALGRALPAKP